MGVTISTANAGATYEPIATYTAPSAQASYTFSSIPSTYTDLVVVVNGASASGTGAMWLQFNNNTGTNYSDTFLQGNGSTATSVRDTSVAALYFGYHSTNQSVWIANLQSYANTAIYKTALARSSGASDYAAAAVGLWRLASAIDTVKVSNTSGSFATNTTFTLYGIRAA